ncbi:MAG: hypothetical protein Q9195_002790 [Heterodermia aff. obscurata]
MRTLFIIDVETWCGIDAGENVVGKPVMDTEPFGARLLLLEKPLDKSALGGPVELCAVTEASLSIGVVDDSRVALVEMEWEGGKAETLKAGARDDVDTFPLEVEFRTSEEFTVDDSVKIELLWSDCAGSWEPATVEVCVGNIVRESRDVDAAIVPEELELTASCEGINVLVSASNDDTVVMLDRMVEVCTMTGLVSEGRGIVDVGTAVE